MATQLERELASFDLRRWLDFNGRIPRKVWWLHYVVPILVINIVIQAIIAIVAAVDFTGLFSAIFAVVGFILSLALIWPALAGYAKRLHDRDMSAWWILIAFVPAIGGLALLVICGFLKGTSGPNRFGPDPLAAPQAFGGNDQATVILRR